MTEKRFTVHIKWFNYEKTEGEIELFDNGQPLLVSECIEDVQMVKDLLNELAEENSALKIDDEFKKKSYSKLLDSFMDLKKKYQTLKQENEQLKKENKELKLQLEAFKDKLCELGVSDVKLYGKRYYTGLEEWLE